MEVQISIHEKDYSPFLIVCIKKTLSKTNKLYLHITYYNLSSNIMQKISTFDNNTLY